MQWIGSAARDLRANRTGWLRPRLRPACGVVSPPRRAPRPHRHAAGPAQIAEALQPSDRLGVEAASVGAGLATQLAPKGESVRVG